MGFENHFLDSLAAADAERLRPHLADIVLSRGAVLSDAGRPIVEAWLPVDSVLSVATVMRDGAQVESRTVGREGGFGLLHALGSSVSLERVTVQVGGRGWRIALPPLREAANASRELRSALALHAQASLIQAAQAGACSALHSAEQRLCRWLLLTQDRLDAPVLPLTQEHLAVMVGVQRTTVTAIASSLQARGAISYVRGKITVRDRPTLERCACECYQAIRRGVAAILGQR